MRGWWLIFEIEFSLHLADSEFWENMQEGNLPQFGEDHSTCLEDKYFRIVLPLMEI